MKAHFGQSQPPPQKKMNLAELNRDTQEQILLLALEAADRHLRDAESAFKKDPHDFMKALALDMAEINFKKLKEIAFD